MSGIVWLASYPKSGNTWMRVFLTNYWRDEDVPADINQLECTPIASARALFEEAVGLESSDLTADEQERLRPAVYRWLVSQPRERLLMMKVHDAYTYLDDKAPLFPPDVTRGVVYILRNPLDVAVSGAAFLAVPVETVPGAMSDARAMIGYVAEGLSLQLRQRLLSWSLHVTSWVDAPEQFPRIVVRYEDMIRDPETTFARVVVFLGLPLDESRLAKAIEFSSFDRLRTQEEVDGFSEKPRKARRFFRNGRAGTWRDHLTSEQVAQIVSDHADVMQRFGYLDDCRETTVLGFLEEVSL